MLGIFVGVLALVLHKDFIICTTAITSGMVSGLLLGGSMGNMLVGVLIGVCLSALGIFVQYRLERKPARDPATVNPFRPLAASAPSTYCPHSGIIVESCSLFKDSGGEIFASVGFRNVGKKPVIAVYYTLLCRSVGGDGLGGMERTVLDVEIAPGAAFSGGELFRLPDRTTRLVSVQMTQVVTAGGEAIHLTEADTVPLPQPRELRAGLSAELVELAGLGPDERYFLTELENGFWICSCGAVTGGNGCHHCGKARGDVLRDNRADIFLRINDRISGELKKAETASGKRDLKAARDSIRRYLELLKSCGILAELEKACAATLRSVEERLSQAARKDAETQKKLRRYALIAGAAACCIVLAVLAVNLVRGLPPSEKEIREDLCNDFFSYFESMEQDAGSEKGLKVYGVELWGEDKELHEAVYLSTELAYRKIHGAYQLQPIDAYDPVITSTQLPSPSDTYTDLCVRVTIGDEPVVICENGNGWSLLSGGVDPGDLSYACEPDYAGAQMTESVADIPVLIRVSYLNLEGELDTTVTYRYVGGRCWEAVSPELFLELNAKEGVLLDLDGLTAVLRNENAVLTDETFPCGYMTLSHESIEYGAGLDFASAAADFVWDNGQYRFEGTLEAQLEYAGGQWSALAVRIARAGRPAPSTALTPDGAAQLLRDAVEAAGLFPGSTVEATADDISEENGVATLAGHYTARDSEYVCTGAVDGRFEFSPETGYRLVGKPSIDKERCRPEQEIAVEFSTPFHLIQGETFPVNQPGSGQAEVSLHITPDGQADIVLDFGKLSVHMTGQMTEEMNISYAGNAQNILVSYYLIFSYYDKSISFTPSGWLLYQDGKLSGTVTFTTRAAGVKNFQFSLGE